MADKKIEKKPRKDSNVLGIIGICTGWLIPIAGLVLGIIALARREKTQVLGIIAIVESVVFWLIWAFVISAMIMKSIPVY